MSVPDELSVNDPADTIWELMLALQTMHPDHKYLKRLKISNDKSKQFQL